MKTLLVFAGGGTGGHIFPALSTARHLNIPVLFVGSSFGMERTLVPAGGFPFVGVPVKGFIGVPVWKKVLRLPLLGWALARTLGLFLTRRPRAVLGFGGYASVPALFWARVLCIPYFLQEQNAIPGAVTRLFASKARAVFAGFPDLELKGRIVVTGNPVRGEIRAVPALDRLELPLKVFILGGSQGSAFLNRLFIDAAPALKALPAVWIHQTGRAEHEKVRAAWMEAGADAVVEPFIERVWETYGWAHLLVCRSGAMTVAESVACGRPALLIPFAGAANDHQACNAAWLVREDAGLMAREKDMGPEALLAALQAILADPSRLVRMSRRLKTLDRPGGLDLLRRTMDPVLGDPHAIS
jgi:UDP-N-acetylglucosamine--N-acetylmuramyl-(pentapeptide) pyrophosphoryl-undecaprenol N-acetylglucosamine transferase